mmetsp:Transcript_938/g.2641  ORF Transcript_938/g.2641 Transcript_938/m.2641 type:complete len:221 (-) Transcript_938:86-748(-)
MPCPVAVTPLVLCLLSGLLGQRAVLVIALPLPRPRLGVPRDSLPLRNGRPRRCRNGCRRSHARNASPSGEIAEVQERSASTFARDSASHARAVLPDQQHSLGRCNSIPQLSPWPPVRLSACPPLSPCYFQFLVPVPVPGNGTVRGSPQRRQLMASASPFLRPHLCSGPWVAHAGATDESLWYTLYIAAPLAAAGGAHPTTARGAPVNSVAHSGALGPSCP